MKKWISKLAGKYTHQRMRTQLIIIYFVAVFTPIMVLGVFLVRAGVGNLSQYHADLLKSNNSRVRSVLFEITNQINNISDEICFDDELNRILCSDFASEEDFKAAVGGYHKLTSYMQNYAGVSEIFVYSGEEYAVDTGCIKAVGHSIKNARWYITARRQYSPIWEIIEDTDDYGNTYRSLALIRKIALYGKDTDAILMVKIDNNYLKNRVDANDNVIILTDSTKEIFYSSDREDYSEEDILYTIDTPDSHFTYEGNMNYHGFSCMTYISTLNMTQSNSNIFVTTIDLLANQNIQNIRVLSFLVIGAALVLPGIIMILFINTFTKQVVTLRDEMFKVSQGDYELVGDFDGCRELDSAYDDLKIMVDRIKEMDEQMYADKISQQELQNEQQKMEFQMLASQINPHFLYNTLEMIRMKAITADDVETAGAIKLLGKSMRYVLDNTGTRYTTIAKEMAHIETYLQIQRLRFGDRVNYTINNKESVFLDRAMILPLLLQPIVENAIVHGLEEVESGGMITVDIEREGESDLLITITDNGCGMDEDTLKNMRDNLEHGTIKERYGIGLYNIHQRTKLCYGEDYGLTIDSRLGVGTRVVTRIKLIYH